MRLEVSRFEVSRLEVSRLWLLPQYAGFADHKEQEVVVGSEVGQAGSKWTRVVLLALATCGRMDPETKTVTGKRVHWVVNRIDVSFRPHTAEWPGTRW